MADRSDKGRALLESLEIPAIVAPMFLVSSPALALATCGEGIVGSFPAHSTRTPEACREWIVEIEAGLAAMRAANPAANIAPYAVNIVTHATNDRMAGDVELCIEYKVPVVLTSKSAPAGVVDQIHAYGGVVFHDVASRRHAEKALEGGVDGLIAVCHGAGGHTGTINPFGLVNEIREFYDGPIILSGALSTGRDLLAAQAMGCDGGYFGTRFIATHESIAPDAYKAMIVTTGASGLFQTAAVDGAPISFITQSLLDAGADLDVLRTTLPGKVLGTDDTKKKWRDLWSAGQGVGAAKEVVEAAALVQQLKNEYRAARRAFAAQLAGVPVKA